MLRGQLASMRLAGEACGSSVPHVLSVAPSSQQPHVLGSDLDRGVQQVDDLVERLVRSGVPSRRILVAGFSQGGALALAAAFKCRLPLGGVAVFSGFLPLPALELDVAAGRPRSHCPLLWCHGDADANVPVLS